MNAENSLFKAHFPDSIDEKHAGAGVVSASDFSAPSPWPLAHFRPVWAFVVVLSTSMLGACGCADSRTSTAASAEETDSAKTEPGQQDVVADNASPIFGVTIPDRYRQWQLISVARSASKQELKAVLGNSLAMKSIQEQGQAFPDGAILAKLSWQHVPLDGFDGAFVAGETTMLQFMVKDSKKYPATGGWGYGRFINGKPVDKAQHESCFTCHEAVRGKDFVFTRFAR